MNTAQGNHPEVFEKLALRSSECFWSGHRRNRPRGFAPSGYWNIGTGLLEDWNNGILVIKKSLLILFLLLTHYSSIPPFHVDSRDRSSKKTYDFNISQKFRDFLFALRDRFSNSSEISSYFLSDPLQAGFIESDIIGMSSHCIHGHCGGKGGCNWRKQWEGKTSSAMQSAF